MFSSYCDVRKESPLYEVSVNTYLKAATWSNRKRPFISLQMIVGSLRLPEAWCGEVFSLDSYELKPMHGWPCLRRHDGGQESRWRGLSEDSRRTSCLGESRELQWYIDQTLIAYRSKDLSNLARRRFSLVLLAFSPSFEEDLSHSFWLGLGHSLGSFGKWSQPFWQKPLFIWCRTSEGSPEVNLR